MELYVHLPFCKRKCSYCDFPSYAGCEQQMPAYVSAVLREAELRGSGQSFQTVFIGGGTPSLLPAAELKRLLGGLRERLDLSAVTEYTTEANPGTLTPEWLEAAVSCGVNRLSMGMQAAQPQLLKTLGRIHTADAVADSVSLAQAAGIENLNLDLMFGLPGQTAEDWRESLNFALSLRPQHLSCYGLIPEPGTPLNDKLESGELTLPDEETERAMYEEARSLTAAYGMRQYEISNFALPGRECQHNLGYWRQIPYLGLGSSAASMLPDPTGEAAYLRETNPPRIDDYISLIAGEGEREREPISRRDAMFESFMLGLRTTEGVQSAAFEAMHGTTPEAVCGTALTEMQRRGLLTQEDGCWRLTRQGMDLQNTVLVAILEEFEK